MTDKDGGMAVTTTPMYKHAISDLLGTNAWYAPVAVHDRNYFTDAVEEYATAATAISVGNRPFRRALMSGMHLPHDSIVAKLQCTVKTHKSSGEVVLRPIHAYGQSVFEPGLKWMQHVLTNGLVHLPHLLKDSNDLCQKLKSFKLPRNVRFIKMDVKDYFLTGSHSMLVQKSSEVVSPELREDYNLLASAILGNQYISSSLAPSTFHRVLKGTGMGMIPSSQISDAALYSLLEKDFILKTSVRRSFEIYFYVRFRDDILLITGASLESNKRLVDAMRLHASPFVLKVESVSKTGCQMLDLDVCVSPNPHLDFDSCVFRLFTKPTNIWQPLSPESHHPRSVHMHWPAAQAKRIFAKFTDRVEGLSAVNNFKFLYTRSFGAMYVEEHLPKLPKQATSWIVLPYSFCLAFGGFARCVRSLVVPDGFCFDKMGLSWSRGEKHLIHLLRRNNAS